MNLIIAINSTGQDQELRVAFDATLKDRNWKLNNEIPDAYIKSIDTNLSKTEIEKIIKADIDAAVEEAEWSEINYVFIISKQEPNFCKSS